jgi:hypothetical protein
MPWRYGGARPWQTSPTPCFAQAAIARLEEQRLVTLEEQAEARLALGEHSLLAAELGELVARHPLRERLRAAHMLALYRAGRHAEAVNSYGELRGRLADDLAAFAGGPRPAGGCGLPHYFLHRQDWSSTG